MSFILSHTAAVIIKILIISVKILQPKNDPISLANSFIPLVLLLNTYNLFVMYAKSTAAIKATISLIFTFNVSLDSPFNNIAENIEYTAILTIVDKAPNTKYLIPS